MTENTTPNKIIDVAVKQRHKALLTKIRNGQALTPREIEELRRYESPAAADEQAPPENAITTQAEAAAYCGVSTRTLRTWEKEYALRDANGRYIVDRLDERIAARSIDDNPLKTRILTADAEHKEVRAELGRIQLAIKRGELVPAETIAAERIERIGETRRVLLAMIRKLPPLLKGKSPTEMTVVLRQEIYYALAVFAGQPVAAPDAVAEVMDLWRQLTAAQKKKARAQMAERTGKLTTKATKKKKKQK